MNIHWALSLACAHALAHNGWLLVDAVNDWHRIKCFMHSGGNLSSHWTQRDVTARQEFIIWWNVCAHTAQTLMGTRWTGTVHHRMSKFMCQFIRSPSSAIQCCASHRPPPVDPINTYRFQFEFIETKRWLIVDECGMLSHVNGLHSTIKLLSLSIGIVVNLT